MFHSVGEYSIEVRRFNAAKPEKSEGDPVLEWSAVSGPRVVTEHALIVISRFVTTRGPYWSDGLRLTAIPLPAAMNVHSQTD